MTITFRLYGYMAESSQGTWRIDDLRLEGTVSAVPEPQESMRPSLSWFYFQF